MIRLEYGYVYQSPVGPLTITADDNGITGLYLRSPGAREQVLPGDSRHIHQAADWLDRYFHGCAPDPGELSLRPAGTPFQLVIWKLLLEIPQGETRTYGELARKAAALLGKEKMSAQAVGGAVGANPISIIIPCHRVVAAGGKPGGYAWGMEAKRWLLGHEGGSYDDQ